jgi:hypothetical protein
MMSDRYKSVSTKKNTLKGIALLLVIVAVFAFGVGVGHRHWPPFEQLKHLDAIKNAFSRSSTAMSSTGEEELCDMPLPIQ